MTSARVFAPAMVIALVDWPGDHGTNARIPPIPVPGKPYRSHTGPIPVPYRSPARWRGRAAKIHECGTLRSRRKITRRFAVPDGAPGSPLLSRCPSRATAAPWPRRRVTPEALVITAAMLHRCCPSDSNAPSLSLTGPGPGSRAGLAGGVWLAGHPGARSGRGELQAEIQSGEYTALASHAPRLPHPSTEPTRPDGQRADFAVSASRAC